MPPCWSLIPRTLLIAAPLGAGAQIVNGSFEADPWPIVSPSGWTGGWVLGQQDGGPMVWVPGGLFGNILVPAAAVIGKEGKCSAGLRSHQSNDPYPTMFQKLTLEAGRAYALTFWAQSMNWVGVKAELRARVLDASGVMLSELNTTPGLGGAGSSGFTEYSLYVPPIPGNGVVTLEFSNRSPHPETEAAVDAVSITPVPRRTAPDLDPPVRSGATWTLSWSDSIPAHTPQTAPSPSGPWTDVSLSSLRVVDGKRRIDLPADTAATMLYIRTVAP